MIVRTLSALSIACIAVAIGLVVFGSDDNTPVVVVLVLAAFVKPIQRMMGGVR